jgi:DNA-binding HxlR family transcriptional regulator
MMKGQIDTSRQEIVPETRELGDPLQIEEYIMRICTELSAQNKVIQISSIYRRARRELKVPGIDIDNAIQRLIQAKKIIPGQVVCTSNVLENETRQIIYNRIASVPCKYPYDLQQELQIGAGLLAWHLKKLVDFGLIKQVSFRTRTLFALPTLDEKDIIIYYISSKSVTIQTILGALSQKSMPKTTLFTLIPAKRTTLLYHLKNLEQWGIVKSTATTPENEQYELTDDFATHVQRVLLQFFTKRN